MITCPKCGYSMMYYMSESYSYWECTNCGHRINKKEQETERNLMKHFINVIFIAVLIGMLIGIFYMNSMVRTLTKKNEYLSERIHFREYDDLEILPCSLCNNEAELYDVGTYDKKYFVKCDHCGYETHTYNTVQDAFDAWNENNSRQN